MIVKGLELGRFFTYADTRIVLPPGLTVLTGENGTGKSAIYEACVWALTGQTVRGSKVRTGQVKLQFEHGPEAYTVSRTRTEKGQQVGFWNGPQDGLIDLTCQTATDTQAKLTQELGSYERLVGSSIFARDFMARFGVATDKERKALLEEMLGLQQFDRALKLARAKLQTVEVQAGRADQDCQHAGRQLQTWREELARLPSPLPLPSTQAPYLEEQIKLLADQYNQVKAGLQPRQDAAQLLVRQADELSGRGRVLKDNEQRLARQLEQGRQQAGRVEQACRQCGRPFDHDSLVKSRRTLQDANDQLERELGAIKADLASAQLHHGLAIEEAEEQQASLQAEQQAQQARKDRHASLKVQLEEVRRHLAERDRLVTRVQAAETDMLDAQARLAQAHQDVLVAQHVVACFGLKGARATLLGRALGGIEREANQVLGRIKPSIKVRLEMTDSDQVGIRLTGAGDGEYRGLSGGERVGVDVALMLGLAARQGSGLLVFDEVFDALDGPAIERVASYVTELAHTRQVLVISHADNLVQLFPHAHHLRCTMGDFSQVEQA